MIIFGMGIGSHKSYSHTEDALQLLN